jgi:hypothetical protein
MQDWQLGPYSETVVAMTAHSYVCIHSVAIFACLARKAFLQIYVEPNVFF